MRAVLGLAYPDARFLVGVLVLPIPTLLLGHLFAPFPLLCPLFHDQRCTLDTDTLRFHFLRFLLSLDSFFVTSSAGSKLVIPIAVSLLLQLPRRVDMGNENLTMGGCLFQLLSAFPRVERALDHV